MKKILLILLILATSVMASEKLYINELFQLGGTLFTPDSVKVRVYSDLAIVADTSVTYTPSGGLLRDSIVGDFASAYELHFGVIVYKASFWGTASMAYFVPIRQSQSFINVDPAYSDSSKMIYVWGRIVGPGRNPGDTIRGVEDAYIYITPSKSSVIDSFGNIYNMIQPIITRTNSLGNWGAYVPISQFLIPETYWTFRGKWPGGGFSTGPIETPNDTTGQLTKDSDGIWAIE